MKDKSTVNTFIRKCTCIHEFQDSRYGNSMRVQNASQKKGNSFTVCTVCGTKHNI